MCFHKSRTTEPPKYFFPIEKTNILGISCVYVEHQDSSAIGGGLAFGTVSNDESKESDTARLHDLAQQYGLAVKLVGDTYLVDGITANGLPQALGYAEGFDRARQCTAPTDEDIATWIPGADYGNPAASPRLHHLAKKNSLLFRQFGNTDRFLDFNAHGLDQALGYVEGFDRAVTASSRVPSDA